MNRTLSIEPLEARYLLAGTDVNGDGKTSAADALAVINHISSEQPAYVSSLDVNDSGTVTALDALIVINELDRDPPPVVVTPSHTVTFSIASNISTYGFTYEQITEAIEEAFERYEEVGDVDFVAVPSGGTYRISSGELYLGGGLHARGWVIGCCSIQIHSGYVSAGHSVNRPDAFWWKAMASTASIRNIVMHEIGHAVLNWGHSSDPYSVMSTNSSTGVFNSAERAGIVAKWGAAK